MQLQGPVLRLMGRGRILKLFVFVALALMAQAAAAETVQVWHHGPVPLDTLVCADVNQSSDVSRICYDKAERFMVIRLKSTYCDYCSIDSGTAQALQSAGSKRQFLESRIRGSGSDEPFDCRIHPIPNKYKR